MKTVNKLLILFLLIWGVRVSSVGAIGAYRIQTQVQDQAEKGVQKIIAEAHFPQSHSEVWILLSHWENFPQFVPRCQTVDIIESNPQQDQIYIRMDLPPALPDLWNTLQVKKDPQKTELVWKMIGGNMEKNEGRVSVRPEGTGSVLKMEVQADPGFFLPDWLITWGTKKFLPKILQAFGDELQREAQSEKSATP